MITTDQIANFKDLPRGIQDEIKSAAGLEYRAFHCVQEILGRDKPYGAGNILFGMAGGFRFFWPDNKKLELFEVTSYGSDRWQWSIQKGLYETRSV